MLQARCCLHPNTTDPALLLTDWPQNVNQSQAACAPALLAALDGPRHRLRLAHRPATQLHAVEAEDCHAAVPAFNYHFAFTEELRRLRPRQQRQQEQEQGWLQGASHQSARQLLLARRRVRCLGATTAKEEACAGMAGGTRSKRRRWCKPKS